MGSFCLTLGRGAEGAREEKAYRLQPYIPICVVPPNGLGYYYYYFMVKYLARHNIIWYQIIHR
jgi:hypothetical protein